MKRALPIRGFCILLLSAFLMLPVSLQAQDEFFTSFRTVGLTLNPAEAGRITSLARFTAVGRTQWNRVSGEPYQSVYAGLETQPFCLEGGNFIGASVSAAREESGSSQFQRLNAQLGFSYHQKLEADVYLAGGAEFGLINHRLGNEDLRFDEQFDGMQYDPGLSNGEEFLRFTVTQPNATAGVLLYHRQGWWSFGAAVDHLLTPSLSFLEENAYNLGMGLVVHGNVQLTGKKQPKVITGFQGMYRRYSLFNTRQWHAVLGGYGVFALGRQPRNDLLSPFLRFDLSARIAGSAGTAGILNDAILLTTTLQQNGWQFGLTYDVNLSRLSRATDGAGGLEFFLGIPIAGEPTCVFCPSF